jgi:hypothetical protein
MWKAVGGTGSRYLRIIMQIEMLIHFKHSVLPTAFDTVEIERHRSLIDKVSQGTAEEKLRGWCRKRDLLRGGKETTRDSVKPPGCRRDSGGWRRKLEILKLEILDHARAVV